MQSQECDITGTLSTLSPEIQRMRNDQGSMIHQINTNYDNMVDEPHLKIGMINSPSDLSKNTKN